MKTLPERSTQHALPWLLALGTLAVFGLTALSWRSLGRYQPFADLMTPPAGAAQVGVQISDAVVSGRTGGRLRWRVAARAISFSRDQRQVTAGGIHNGILYDGQGRPALSVSAGRAVYAAPFALLDTGGASAGGMLRLEGGIQAAVLRAGGPALQAAALTWDALTGQARCPGIVSARFPGGTASGDGLTLNTHTGDLSLQRLHGRFLLAAVTPAATSGTASVTYDAGASRWLNAPRTVEMSQGVLFSQDDAHLQTEAALVNLDDQQRALNAKSGGPVHLYDTQNDLTGAQGFVDFTRHLATLSGHIVLTVKPGPHEQGAGASSARRKFQQPATMTCDTMTYDYKRKRGRVPGPLTVRQSIPRKDGGTLRRTLTADAADYDSRAQTVVLTGHVHGQDSDGNVIQATAPAGKGVTIGLQEGAEYIQVPLPLHGVFPTKDEPDDGTSDTPAPTHSPLVPTYSPPAPVQAAPATH